MISKPTKNHPLFLDNFSSLEKKYHICNLHTINKSDPPQIAHFVRQPLFFFSLFKKPFTLGAIQIYSERLKLMKFSAKYEV